MWIQTEIKNTPKQHNSPEVSPARASLLNLPPCFHVKMSGNRGNTERRHAKMLRLLNFRHVNTFTSPTSVSRLYWLSFSDLLNMLSVLTTSLLSKCSAECLQNLARRDAVLALLWHVCDDAAHFTNTHHQTAARCWHLAHCKWPYDRRRWRLNSSLPITVSLTVARIS